MNPIGPGSPYRLLFDNDTADGRGLSPQLRAIYGGDWRLPPAPTDRPFIFTNFVVSHDGRIAFNQPGYEGGGPISRHAAHDIWMIALTRARADAILTGAATLRTSRRHRFTPATAFPPDTAAFAFLRTAEGRRPLPIFVVVSASGELPADARALQAEEQDVIVATTEAGYERVQRILGPRPRLRYHITPSALVDLGMLAAALRADYGVETLLSEGGAHTYGALISQGLIDEAFITRSPVVVGNPPAPAPPRPTLVEGVAFHPDAPPQLELVSLRCVGNYLFERVRYLPGISGR